MQIKGTKNWSVLTSAVIYILNIFLYFETTHREAEARPVGKPKREHDALQ